MTPEKTANEKPKKSITLDECIKKADEYIKSSGSCLFLFDVKDSKKYPNRQELQDQLKTLTTELNSEFNEYFPENDLMVKNRLEKGFAGLLGDGSWAGINSIEAITQIVNYIHQKLPSVQFYFDVARNGFDSPNLKILK